MSRCRSQGGLTPLRVAVKLGQMKFRGGVRVGVGSETLGKETEGDGGGQRGMADRRTDRWTREEPQRKGDGGYPDRSLETRAERGKG